MTFFFFLKPPIVFEFYQHSAIVLGEGLKSLGYNFSANTDYWFDLEEQNFLFKKGIPKDFDVHIYSSHYLRSINHDVDIFYNKFNVLIDSEDGVVTIGDHKKYKDFDLILKCHFHDKKEWPKNFQPFAFGLTNRIINELDNSKNREIESKCYVSNRVYYNIRKLGRDKFKKFCSHKYPLYNYQSTSKNEIDSDEFSYWYQTNKRHDELYFKNMNSSKFTLCFGGGLIPFHKNLNNLIKLKTARTVFRQLIFLTEIAGFKNSSYYLNYQYDSWRLWESFYSNSIPITLDFSSWSQILPENPVSFKHFIGIKNLDFYESFNILNELKEDEITTIRRNGQKWVEENYFPEPLTSYFLSLIKYKK